MNLIVLIKSAENDEAFHPEDPCVGYKRAFQRATTLPAHDLKHVSTNASILL